MIISIDLDAFYCGVEEREDSKLRGQPFAVVQKHILATVSYPARRLGVKKLEGVLGAKQRHPELITVNGEDLTKYRAAGKTLYQWMRHEIVEGPVERLGLEEMRADIGPSIEASLKRFPPNDVLKELLLDPEFGDEVLGYGAEIFCGTNKVHCENFYFSFEGNTWPPDQQKLENSESLEAYIAGNLAQYIRDRMWMELGYSCSIGVASSKAYAKIACGLNKPRGVTVVIPGHEAAFMRTIPLAKIPGFGRATMTALAPVSTVAELLDQYDEHSFVQKVSSVVPPKAASSLWLTAVGEEPPEVGKAIEDYAFPKQISIEESYYSPCQPSQWDREVGRLVDAVLMQARSDLYDEQMLEWLAVPQSLRVSIIFPGASERRKSRSARISWLQVPKTTLEDQLADLNAGLTVKARRLLREVAGKAAPRLINVALVMSAAGLD